MGSVPLVLPAGTDKSITVPFRIPGAAPVGVYVLVLRTVTSDGVIESSATFTVLP